MQPHPDERPAQVERFRWWMAIVPVLLVVWLLFLGGYDTWRWWRDRVPLETSIEVKFPAALIALDADCFVGDAKQSGDMVGLPRSVCNQVKGARTRLAARARLGELMSPKALPYFSEELSRKGLALNAIQGDSDRWVEVYAPLTPAVAKYYGFFNVRTPAWSNLDFQFFLVLLGEALGDEGFFEWRYRRVDGERVVLEVRLESGQTLAAAISGLRQGVLGTSLRGARPAGSPVEDGKWEPFSPGLVDLASSTR